jgi:hypothetical protein
MSLIVDRDQTLPVQHARRVISLDRTLKGVRAMHVSTAPQLPATKGDEARTCVRTFL